MAKNFRKQTLNLNLVDRHIIAKSNQELKKNQTQQKTKIYDNQDIQHRSPKNNP